MATYSAEKNIKRAELDRTIRELCEEINTKRAELDRILREIGSLEANLINCEREMQTLNQEAGMLENRARELDKEAETKKQRSYWGGLASFGTGLVLAPFTGGLSLAGAFVVAGLNAGYNLGSASECLNAAKEKRGTAKAKSMEVQNWHSQKMALVAKKEELKKQIGQLEQKIEEQSKHKDQVLSSQSI